MNPAITVEAVDSIVAMRFAMVEALQDLKWHELDAIVPGETMYQSPGDSLRFTMSREGTHWAFSFDNSDQSTTVYYKTFAEGDIWVEFERALLLAQAIEEELPGKRDQLIGKWWDSFDSHERFAWWRTENRRMPPDYADPWRALTGNEREAIETEVLKGARR